MKTVRIKAKRTAIDQAINITPNFKGQSEEMKTMMASLAQFDESKGGFTINIDGEQKLITELTSENIESLKPDEERARTIAMNTLGLTEQMNNSLKKIGYVFQHYELLPELTAIENIYLPLMVEKGISREIVEKSESHHQY
jgi:ABC-type polar amino acid transport system ATPase subunit